MKISAPQPIPENLKKVTPGRPSSPIFLALQALKVGQCINISVEPGASPSISSIRAQVTDWSKRLGCKLSYRTSSCGQKLTILRPTPTE